MKNHGYYGVFVPWACFALSRYFYLLLILKTAAASSPLAVMADRLVRIGLMLPSPDDLGLGCNVPALAHAT